MPVITVSRGTYSGGKEIAECVAARISAPCLSREILVEAAEKFGIPEHAMAEAMSKPPSVLERFSSRAATPGRDALGEVSIQASIDGHTFTGRGAHTDVVRASAEAFLHAVNKAAAARSLEGARMAATSEIGGV